MRAEMLRRVSEQLRRSIPLKTKVGDIRIPVGGHRQLIFHLDNYEKSYITLNAQTHLLEGRIGYNEIRMIVDYLSEINRRQLGVRKAQLFYMANLPLILVAVSISVLLIMATIVLITDFDSYISLFLSLILSIALIIIIYLFAKYYFTQNLRETYRQGEAFLRRINVKAKDSGLFFKLGKNMIWVECHILGPICKPQKPASESADEGIGGTEVEATEPNPSVCLNAIDINMASEFSSTSLPAFSPSISIFSEMEFLEEENKEEEKETEKADEKNEAKNEGQKEA